MSLSNISKDSLLSCLMSRVTKQANRDSCCCSLSFIANSALCFYNKYNVVLWMNQIQWLLESGGIVTQTVCNRIGSRLDTIRILYMLVTCNLDICLDLRVHIVLMWHLIDHWSFAYTRILNKYTSLYSTSWSRLPMIYHPINAQNRFINIKNNINYMIYAVDNNILLIVLLNSLLYKQSKPKYIRTILYMV